jgi:ribulose 1,5-bisphosphate synthetase/thiazole synthase
MTSREAFDVVVVGAGPLDASSPREMPSRDSTIVLAERLAERVGSSL